MSTPPGSSTVEMTLAPVDGGTLVRLVHSGLPSPEAVKAHDAGWAEYMPRLAIAAAGNPMNYGMVDLASGDVAGGIGPAPEGQPRHAMFYVGVDDVEATLQKAESLGGARVFGPMEVPDGPTIGHFADPKATS